MKRSFMSAGVLFLVLVGLLGALAVGYGLWSKTLTVQGTVKTGNFEADWDWAMVSDQGLDPCTPLNPNGCNYPPKDVGSCSVDGVGTQRLVITINNAYPSYECLITARVTNTGTIPFNIVGAAPTSPVPDEIDVVCGGPDLPVQVDPGDEAEGWCWVHVRQEAKERSDYTASAILCVAQWNEAPTFDECVASAGQSEP